MSDSNVTISPLGNANRADLKKLCQALWDWRYCSRCNDGEPCQMSKCPWQRSDKLEPFFDFYRKVTAWHIAEVPGGGEYALRGHDDLFSIVRLIKQKSDVPRSILTEEFFSQYDRKPNMAEQHRAFDLAVRIMSMLNCSIDDQSLDRLEMGPDPTIWANDKTYSEFIEKAFPFKAPPILHENGLLSEIEARLNAIQLKKVARIRFQGTDDLKNHLKLDTNTGILQLFHHVTFLREHLLATQDSLLGSAVVQSVILPRQLALETHDSLEILFPSGHDSVQLLRSLASQKSLDFDYPAFGRMEYRREDESEAVYCYWGHRLLELYEELKEPRPRGIFHWVQERTKKRHFMMLTIAGVLFAILSLAVSLFSAWVSYQQWKHPVNNSNP